MKELRQAGVDVTAEDYSRLLMTFTARPGGTVKARPGSAAAAVQGMRENGVQPNQYCYHMVIQSFAEAKDADGAVRWFEEMVAAGVPPVEKHHTWAVYAIKTSAATKNSEVNATMLYERMIAASTTAQQQRQRYDLIVRSNIEMGDIGAAADWCQRAEAAGSRITKATCEIAAAASMQAGSESYMVWWVRKIPVASNQGDKGTIRGRLAAFVKRSYLRGNSIDVEALDNVAAWVRRLALSQVDPHDLPYETFVQAYARAAKSKEASLWLDKMVDLGLSPSPAAFRELILSAGRAGNEVLARQWFKRIRLSGTAPDVSSYSAVLCAHATRVDPGGALEWMEHMRSAGFQPEAEAYSFVVQSFSRAGDAGAADTWYWHAVKEGHRPSGTTLAEVVQAHVDVGNLRKALALSTDAVDNGVYTGVKVWTTQLRAAASATRAHIAGPEDVEEVAREMMRAGHEPGRQAIAALQSSLGTRRCEELLRELGVRLDKILAT